jgi:hypothetical protein
MGAGERGQGGRKKKEEGRALARSGGEGEGEAGREGGGFQVAKGASFEWNLLPPSKLIKHINAKCIQ